MHNFISLNKYIIKSTYFMHYMKKMLIILIKSKFIIYFCSNVVNKY